MKKKRLTFIIALLAIVGLACFFSFTSCGNKKVKYQVVQNFDLKKYQGQWYEIARFDFKYEKDLSNVTANYSLKEDGSIKVVNKGYNYVKKEWEEKEGKAKFNDTEEGGALMVSFFGPFYAQYNVVCIEDNYNYALVFGENNDYIWFLSRTPQMPDAVKNNFKAMAEKAGYDLNRLVWTEHNK